MKIIIRACCKPDVIAALATDADIAAAYRLSDAAFDVEADSVAFARLLAVSRTRSHCWFNPRMEFTADEVAASRFFQLECRKMLKESQRDYDHNIARLKARPMIRNGPGANIRLLDRISLRAASLKPNQVACAGDWMAEFVVAGEVARIFGAAGLTGVSWRPVLDSRTGRDYEDVVQLYTEEIMPRALLDATTPHHPDHPDPADRRQLACLSYAFSGQRPRSDFLRTAEAWSSNDMPVWIVSAAVRDCFTRQQLKGWAFRPVLEADTELHAGYLRTWNDLMAQVADSNPRHFF